MPKKAVFRLIISYVLVSIVIFGLTKLSAGRFSTKALTHLTEATGKSKLLTTNPCINSILGDPDAGKNYIRLIVTCSDGKRSTNTFDAGAINGGTLEMVLSEFHRINGVSGEVRSYKCKKDSAPIELLSSITAPTTLECEYVE